MFSLLRLERQQKDFLKSISNSQNIPLWIFIHETTNAFMHSLENYTRIQTKKGKVYTRFQTKTAQKPYSVRQIYGSTPPEINIGRIANLLHFWRLVLCT